MQQLQRQSQETVNRQSKCFSNRAAYNHLEPYSHDFLKAKRKAFERYKKIYPVQEKQNLYQMAKNPYLGYYVMKGYKPKNSEQDDCRDKMSNTHAKSSEKIIGHMIKKYLHRKEQSNNQFEILPKLEHSVDLSVGHLTSLNLKKGKKNVRLFTEYEGKQTKVKRAGQATDF